MIKNKNNPKDNILEEKNSINVPEIYEVQKDNPIRSLLKTFSWRIIATSTTFLISFIVFRYAEQTIIKSLENATYIAGIEFIAKLFLYYLHERFWTNVRWGKKWEKNKLIRMFKLSFIKNKRS